MTKRFNMLQFKPFGLHFYISERMNLFSIFMYIFYLLLKYNVTTDFRTYITILCHALN